MKPVRGENNANAATGETQTYFFFNLSVAFVCIFFSSLDYPGPPQLALLPAEPGD